jgi:uncharacterized protein (TIGR03083 family)
MPSVRDAFWSALDAAVGVLGQPEVAAAWTQPSALDGMTVGGLVAHLLMAVERTALVLESVPPDAETVRVVGLPEFYGPNRIEQVDDLAAGLPALVREGAAARAAPGPEAVVAEVRALPARLRPAVDAAPEGRLVPVVQVRNGAARFDEYLVTRVVELVVHADDVACSVGTAAPEIPPPVLAVVTSAFLDLAVARSGGVAVVRAFARRERAAPDVLRVL